MVRFAFSLWYSFVTHTCAYSAYRFEWGKQRGLDQPTDSFADYVHEAFQHSRSSAIEDYQIFHVANRGPAARAPSKLLSDEQVLKNAVEFVDSLPYFGPVERFPESVARAHYYFGAQVSGFRGRIFFGECDVNRERGVGVES